MLNAGIGAYIKWGGIQDFFGGHDLVKHGTRSKRKCDIGRWGNMGIGAVWGLLSIHCVIMGWCSVSVDEGIKSWHDRLTSRTDSKHNPDVDHLIEIKRRSRTIPLWMTWHATQERKLGSLKVAGSAELYVYVECVGPSWSCEAW